MATIMKEPVSEPFSAPGAAPARRPINLLVPPLLSAGLLYLAYFPAGLSWIAWFALVPLLALVRRQERSRAIYVVAFLGGLAFYWPALQWLRVADVRMYATWAILATWCSFFIPAGVALLRWLDRRTRLSLTFTTPIVWVGLDYFRARFIGGFASLLMGSHQHDLPGGFGWYFLGHSQHAFLEVIQIADLGGAFAVSFLVALVNGLFFEILFNRPWFRGWFVSAATPVRCSRLSLLGQGLIVMVVLFATLGYGVVRLGEPVGGPGPTIALIQTNIDQRIRNEGSAGSQKQMVDTLGDLSHLATRFHPDLIVWPETSWPGYWEELEPGRPSPDSQLLADELANHYRTNILIGLNACVTGEDLRQRCYNSAVLIVPRNGGKGQWVGRYDKIHRVPFGEYIPMHSWLPFLGALSPYGSLDYVVQPGRTHTRFLLPAKGKGYTFGVVICYEDTDPVMARPYGGGDGLPPADFLLNISNDGWFDGTVEHDQHLSLCRFRAIECRRSIARSVNMGISALIDSNGRVLLPQTQPATPPAAEGAVWKVGEGEKEQVPLARWHEFKKTSGVLLATIPIDDRLSFYARFGDWLPVLCWIFLGFVKVRAFLRRRLMEAAT